MHQTSTASKVASSSVVQKKDASDVSWTVEGMTCANCAANINRYLEKGGLQDVQVNFSTKEVRFRIPDGQQIDLAGIESGLSEMGYRVVHDEDSAAKPFWTLERKLLFGALLTAPLLGNHLLMMVGLSIEALDQPWVQLLLCLPVYVLGFVHFGRSAWGSLKGGVPNMDVLIFIGSTAAFVYSLIGTFWGNPDYIFYETAATIITLVLAGNYMEHKAVQQTTSAIMELSSLQVEKARKLMPSGAVVTLLHDEVQVGDVLLVNEGDRIPTDGEVLEGEVLVDESMLTGESVPVLKRLGDRLIGGSIVVEGQLKMVAKAVGKDTVLARMIELVKTAQQEKPSIQRLADRISAVFVPVVVTIAALTFFGGWLVFSLSAPQALMNAIAVLVISCPCAMGLATPTAVMVGVGRMARSGILVKGGATVETFAHVRQLVFDKTGTLTTGKFRVAQVSVFDHRLDEDQVLNLIYQLEQRSSHPIARSLVAELAPRVSGSNHLFEWVDEQRGLGLVAKGTDGHTYRLGSAALVAQSGSKLPVGYSIYLLQDATLIAALRIEDELKPDAMSVVRWLKAHDRKPILLSGDRREKVEAIARQLGIEEWYAEQLPEQKLQLIEQLSAQQPTAMVGDGINDAPALARATVGVSLSDGSNAAIESAQIVLLKGQLRHLVSAIQLAELTLRTIKENLFWAFAYNVVAIPIAAMGYLNPMWGALFMAFSDVVVIGNSIRLRKRTPPPALR